MGMYFHPQKKKNLEIEKYFPHEQTTKIGRINDIILMIRVGPMVEIEREYYTDIPFIYKMILYFLPWIRDGLSL